MWVSHSGSIFLIVTLLVLGSSAQNPASSTAKPKDDPTTPEPTSSTTSSTTTTSTSTTVAPTTSSSTVAPTTEPLSSTTVEPSSSTPEPTPTPAPTPTVPTYGVKNEDGKYCLAMQAKVVFTVNGTNIGEIKNGSVDDKNSFCSNQSVVMWIQFTDGKAQFTFNITGKKDDGSDLSTFISEIAMQMNKHTAEKSDLKQYETKGVEYFKCDSANTVKLENGYAVIFSKMRYQYFQKGADKLEFTGKRLECPSDYKSNLIVVAVGCAMGLLVIIFLVAYLIGRRRNRQRGYQSV